MSPPSTGQPPGALVPGAPRPSQGTPAPRSGCRIGAQAGRRAVEVLGDRGRSGRDGTASRNPPPPARHRTVGPRPPASREGHVTASALGCETPPQKTGLAPPGLPDLEPTHEGTGSGHHGGRPDVSCRGASCRVSWEDRSRFSRRGSGCPTLARMASCSLRQGGAACGGGPDGPALPDAARDAAGYAGRDEGTAVRSNKRTRLSL